MKYFNSLVSKCFLVSLILMIACNPDLDVSSSEPKIRGSLISKEEAITIARDFIATQSKRNSKNAKPGAPNLKAEAIKGPNKKVTLYIINDADGGWQLVAGAKMENPILAFGEKGSFDADTKKMNPGLKMWFTNTIGQMELAYINPDLYYSATKSDGSPNYIIPPEDPTCAETYSEVLPLIVDAFGNDVQFGQGFPENYYYLSCTWDWYYQGRAPAGCVPVAMAQVMWYYKSPATYNWGIIPRQPFVSGSISAQMETGRLVFDAKHYLEPWVWVTCQYGTGAFTSTFNNLDKAFDYLGYDAYQFSSSSTLQNEISAGRPVIAVGGNTLESDRHCWVIDGRKNFNFCDTGTSYMYLHCNWGWSNLGSQNGWYGIGGYNPPGHNFNSNLHYFKIVKR